MGVSTLMGGCQQNYGVWKGHPTMLPSLWETLKSGNEIQPITAMLYTKEKFIEKNSAENVAWKLVQVLLFF